MDAFGISPEHRFTMGLGGRPLFGVVGHRPRCRTGHRQRAFSRIPQGRERWTGTSPGAVREEPAGADGLLGVEPHFFDLPTLAVLLYDQRLARLRRMQRSSGEQRQDPRMSPKGALAGAALVLSSVPGHLDAGAGFHREVARRGAEPKRRTSRCRMLRPIAGLHSAMHWRRAGRDARRRQAGRHRTDRDTSVHDGNRPSSLPLTRKPRRTLGGLLALYEHSVRAGQRLGERSVRRGPARNLAVGIDMSARGRRRTWRGGIGIAHRLCMKHR